MRLPPTVAVFLAAATIASASCKYQNRPPNGAMLCGNGGPGTKRCPDGYECYQGTKGTNCSNTCWKVGDEPDIDTQCSGQDAGVNAGAGGDGQSDRDSVATDGNEVDAGGRHTSTDGSDGNYVEAGRRDTSTDDATNDAGSCGTCPQGAFCGSGGM